MGAEATAAPPEVACTISIRPGATEVGYNSLQGQTADWEEEEDLAGAAQEKRYNAHHHSHANEVEEVEVDRYVACVSAAVVVVRDIVLANIDELELRSRNLSIDLHREVLDMNMIPGDAEATEINGRSVRARSSRTRARIRHVRRKRRRCGQRNLGRSRTGCRTRQGR